MEDVAVALLRLSQSAMQQYIMHIIIAIDATIKKKPTITLKEII